MRSERVSEAHHFRGSGRVTRWMALAALLVGLGACARQRAAADGPYAEFGIFYGGQVQERDQIPLELDQTRQTQGFRLQLEPPPAAPVEVRWELGMPGQGRPQRDSRGRLARPRKVVLGRAVWRPGEAVFEQALPFSPGDPLGLWSIRVLLGERTVIDRAFWVYDAAERARREPPPFAGDAGPNSAAQ